VTTQRRRRILERAQELGALTFGDFVLSSGDRSGYYFDGRLLTLDPEGADLVSQEMLELALSCGATAIGGPTLGADPIVGAAVLASGLAGSPVRGFLVRGETKGHGTGRLIEGPLGSGADVVIVDDTCSTGGSLFRAIAAVEAEGCRVAHVGVVLDRHQGGDAELRRKGYPFTALLEATPEGAITAAACFTDG
jgi:orotate phosphoribosyltransferase